MLLERVRRAVAPDYEILSEIAGGGMGLVFVARQRRLDRKVAIKILRPELATAIAAERFLAEGRWLARLAHPNIVPVYDAGEADGLLYFVMEYVEGETLAERLSRGPLSPEDATRLAGDLLGALSAAHAIGVVHRDVKPANIFLRKGRALLGDFGIGREEHGEHAFTTPGEQIGTLRYMAPEQRDGLPATTRTDVYAAGLVLWEACTGVRWPHYQDPAKGDWDKLPPRLALPVRRALALEPEQRWENAQEFATAIGAVGRRISPRALLLAAVLVTALGIAGYQLLAGHPRPAGAGLTIVVERFTGTSPALGDSIAEAIREQLRGPDFNVLPAGQLGDSTALRLGGGVIRSGARLNSFRLEERQTSGGRGNTLVVPARESEPQDWRAAVDTLSADLVLQIWEREDQFLPTDALPRTNQGKRRFITAERLWSRAQWEAANAAYRDAERTDPTCAICAFRLLDIARWLGTEQDTAHLHRVVREQERFSPLYQALIHAMSTPLPARLDSLQHAAAAWPGFYLASFTLGDELFHRGALYGHLRREAAEPFNRTVRLAPRFDPGWEHLAFFRILEGDSAGVDTALGLLGTAAPGSEFSGAFRTLLRLGFAWRFLDSTGARQVTRAALGAQSIRANSEAAGGARLLVMLDAPRGSIELGTMLAGLGDPAAVRGGLLGQLTGYAALGRLAALKTTGARLHREGYDLESLLALEFEVVLRCFDPDPTLCDDQALSEALQDRLAPSAGGARAAWVLALQAIRSGQAELAATARQALALEPGARSLDSVLDAAVRLSQGQFAEAVQRLPRLPPLEDEARYDDPLEDAVVRLLRSEAAAKQQQSKLSADLLLWQEHVQLTGHMTGDPQAGEMAWALGTLVRWKRARLLDTVDPGTVEHCSIYRAVARNWHDAPAPYGARADSAERSLTRLGCATPP
jgi:protein kinase-like protein